MKNSVRLILLTLLALTLLGLLLIGASAQSYTDDTAKEAGLAVRVGNEGGSYYATLADAVAAASAGDTITVLASHVTDGMIIDKDLTINGQGLLVEQRNTIKVASCSVVFEDVNLLNRTVDYVIFASDEAAYVTIRGAKTKIYGNTGTHVLLIQRGHITIEDGSYSSNGCRLIWTMYEGSTATINGGSFSITEGNNRLLGGSDGLITINGGTFVQNGTGSSCEMLFTEASAAMVINGGTFRQERTNLGLFYIKNGTKVTVNGGTFTSTYLATLGGELTIGGGTLSGIVAMRLADCSFIMTDGTLKGDVINTKVATSLSISGGTLESKISLGFAGSELTVSGGLFKSETPITVNSGTVNLSGGRFAVTNTPILSATGASVINLSGSFSPVDMAKYTLADSTVLNVDGVQHYPALGADDATQAANGYVARIGSGDSAVYYKTVDDALAAAKNGDTITLIAGSESAPLAIKTQTISKSLTINGADHYVTRTDGGTEGVATAWLTLKNGSVTLQNINITCSTGQIIRTDTDDQVLNLYNVSITATGGDKTSLNIFRGTLNIYSGTYTAPNLSDARFIWANNGYNTAVEHVNIYGGIFYGSSRSRCLVGGGANADLNIVGGSFHVTYSSAVFLEGNATCTLGGNDYTFPQFTKTGSNATELFDLNTAGAFTVLNASASSPYYLFECRNAKGSLVIKGGSFNLSSGAPLALLSAAANIQIDGGSFYVQNQNGLFVCANTGLNAYILISGGDFASDDYPLFNVSALLDLTVSGGSFSSDNAVFSINAPTALAVTGGSFASQTNVFEINSAADLTVSGEPVFFALYNVILIAADGADVTVAGGELNAGKQVILAQAVCDITVSGGVLCSSTYAIELQAAAALEIGGDALIEGYSAAIHIPTGFDGATVLINGGTLYSYTYTLRLVSLVSLTINDGTITGKGTPQRLAYISNTASTTNITGGLFEHPATATSYLLYAQGKINVSGGRFANHSSQLTLYVENSDTVITGGTFICDGAAEILVRIRKSSASIYGGYFESNGSYVFRSDEGTTTNIYGGYAHHTGSAGAVVRLATGSTTLPDIMNIWGGTFVADSSAAYIFQMARDDGLAELNLYSYTCSGGALIHYNDSLHYQNALRYHSYNALSVMQGASVRLVPGSSGVRFTSTIPASLLAMIDGLKLPETTLSFGTVIVPADYLADGSSFSLDKLKAEGLPYLDIPAVTGLVENEDGSLTIRASIVNIKPVNYTRSFAAVVYVKYTQNDGTAKGKPAVYFSGYREADQARSIYQIARLAYEDLSETRAGRYLHGVTYNGQTLYSPYTATQRSLLAQYFDTSKPLEAIDLYIVAGQAAMANGGSLSAVDQLLADGYTNILYTGVSAVTGSKASSVTQTALTEVSSGRHVIGVETGLANVLSQVYHAESGKTACVIEWTAENASLLDVVNEAAGGNWLPPSYIETYGANHSLLSGMQYRTLIATVKQGVTQLQLAGYNSISVKGVIWLQGTADSTVTSLTHQGATLDFSSSLNTTSYPVLNTSLPYSYPSIFKMLVADLRADLGAITKEDLSAMPVILTELADTNATRERNFIQMQSRLTRQINDLYTISTSAITLGCDGMPAEDCFYVGQLAGVKLMKALFNTTVATPSQIGASVAAVYRSSGALVGSYTDLATAFNAAPAGGRVEILADVTLNTSTLTISNTKAFTVNGNGKLLYARSGKDAVKFSGTNLVINDWNIIQASNSTSVYVATLTSKAKVTINSGRFEAGHTGIMLGADGCSLTVNGGVFTARRASSVLHAPIRLKIESPTLGSSITVNGGRFEAAGTLGSCISVYANGGASTLSPVTVVINGGSFVGNEGYFCITNGKVSNHEYLSCVANLFVKKENVSFEGGELCNMISTEQTLEIERALTELRAAYSDDTELKAAILDYLSAFEVDELTEVDKIVVPSFSYNGTTYKSMQGGVSDGKYCYIHRYLSDDKATIIQKIDIATGQVVAKSAPLFLGHANDAAYNPNTNQLVICHNSPNRWEITVVDADTLEVIEVKTLGILIFALAYNAERNLYVAGLSGGQNLAILDENFNLITQIDVAYTTFTTQGITCDDSYIYCAQYNGTVGSLLVKYDWEGNFAGSILLPAFDGSRNHEIEHLTVVGDRLYVGVNRFTYNNVGIFVYELSPKS